jgi:hypothetical protein
MSAAVSARLAAVAALLVVACAAVPGNAVAQSAPGASAAEDGAKPSRARKSTAKKEPTAGQMAARERQRKCAGEWKEAKAGGKVASGMKWPKYWSQCNARLKEQRA